MATQGRERPELDLGTGWSDAIDAAIAGQEAVEGALGGRVPRSVDLVVVFADVTFDALALVDAVSEAAAPARVVASSSTAPFSTSSGPARCVATYLPAGDLRFGIGWSDVAGGRLQEAAGRAVADARDEAAHHGDDAVVLLLSDVSTGDQRDVVRGAYNVAGATVPLVGGVVGSDLRPDGSWIAAEGMVLRPGLVAVWLASTSKLGVAFDHGWKPVSRPMQVTAASESELLELDGRPAAEAYLEARSMVAPELVDLGIPGMELPIGVPHEGGGYEVRAFATSEAQGTKLCGQVHEQAIVRLMGAQHHDLIEGAGRAASAAVAELGRPARGALVFSCNIRLDLLQDKVIEEIATIDAALQGSAAVGFFTHGEFAKVPGSQGFHSASVAVLAL